MGVDERDARAARTQQIGAGDQGLMFGYATNETPELMPLPIALAHRIIDRITECARRHDQVRSAPTARARSPSSTRTARRRASTTVVVSTQHATEVEHEDDPRGDHEAGDRAGPADGPDRRDTRAIYINPTGRFVVGGPHGDAGVTGRKIIVDTYGGMGRHGGGAFSGKDPTKVDRSAAYMARYVAKNVVAAGLAEPLRAAARLRHRRRRAGQRSTSTPFGTGKIPDARIAELVEDTSTSPRRGSSRPRPAPPIYRKTAADGHFGRTDLDLPWERTDRAAELRDLAGLRGEVPV